eukprot:Polyplicarium_translucidae@DN2759_c0_g1_i10.p2
MSASRYSYLGGFDATSNVRAGMIFDIPVRGTHAHAFVSSFSGLEEVRDVTLLHRNCEDPQKACGNASFRATATPSNPENCTSTRSTVRKGSIPVSELRCHDFVDRVLRWRDKLVAAVAYDQYLMNTGELAAFVSYASTFPSAFLCLVDTYDTLHSGIPNFLTVALALHELGFKPVGIRLDSGDLAYLSKKARKAFCKASDALGVPFEKLMIVASNDINEQVLHSLNEQQHEIDSFGIGTHLVTCQAQPSLGLVYKLCQCQGRPTMKLSQELTKTTLPGRKSVFRLYIRNVAVADLIQLSDQPAPKMGSKAFCRHVFDEGKRCYIVPTGVEELLSLTWDCGKFCGKAETLHERRDRCAQQLRAFRPDYLRLVNPTPYKVSLTQEYYMFFRDMWQETAPIFVIH